MSGHGQKKSSAKSSSGGNRTPAKEVPFWDLTVVEEAPAQSADGNEKRKDAQYGSAVEISFSLVDSQHFTTQCASCRSRDRLSELLATFQLIPGAKFDWKSNPSRWLFPINHHDQLSAILERMHGIVVEPLPKSVLREFKCGSSSQGGQGDVVVNKIRRITGEINLEDHIPANVLEMLAPFQREGVEFVLRGGGRSLIADDMGLGKTRTAIAAALVYRKNWPVLIVCPAVAKNHWYSELDNVLVQTGCIHQKDVLVVDNASQDLVAPGKKRTPCKFVIMSYTVVKSMQEKMRRVQFGMVVTDECHYLKNSKAIRTKVLVPMLQKAKRALMISGTPALSRPIELFTQLNALDKSSWPDERDFGKRYCRSGGASGGGGGLRGGGGGDAFRGARNCRELHTILTSERGLMIRRLKKDILTQLPEKKRRVVRLKIKDDAKVQELSEVVSKLKMGAGQGSQGATASQGTSAQKRRKKGEAVDETSTTTTGTVPPPEVTTTRSSSIDITDVRRENMSQLLLLFSRSGLAKVEAFLVHLGAHLDDPDSGKILIFAHHTPVMDAIEAYVAGRGEELVRIDGLTQSADRFANTRHFQTQDSCRVALLAITAAGIGITLTAASKVFFCELFWTPGSLIQAEDRAHRMGQEKEVEVTYFLADHSIDDILWPLLLSKVKTLGEIVEGSGSQDFDFSIAGEGTSSSPSTGSKRGRARRGSAVDKDSDLAGEQSSASTSNDNAIVDLTALEGVVKEFAVSAIIDEGGGEGASSSSSSASSSSSSAVGAKKGDEEDNNAESIVQSALDANTSVELAAEQETHVDVIARHFAKLHGKTQGSKTTSPSRAKNKAPVAVDLTKDTARTVAGDADFSYADALDRQNLYLTRMLEAERLLGGESVMRRSIKKRENTTVE